MAKFALKPNAEIDVLTADELRTILDEQKSGWSRPPIPEFIPAAIALDGNGDSIQGVGQTGPLAVTVWTPPAGYQFALHRISVDVDGATYNLGAPYTSSTGYLKVLRAGRYITGINFTNPGLPRDFSAGSANAPIFLNNVGIDIYVVGGPPSTSLIIEIQGTLEPVTIL